MSGPWDLFQSQDTPSQGVAPLPAPEAGDGPWKLYAPSGTTTGPATDPADGRPLTIQPKGEPTWTDELKRVGSAVDAGVRAAANGATLGMADRFAAGMGALTGVGGAQGDYAGNLAGQQAETTQEAQQYPVTTTLGGLAGAVATPGMGTVAAIATRPTLLGKIGMGALTGAGMGAVQGAMQSPDLTDAATTGRDAGEGALTGGVIGSVLPGVAAGAGAFYRGATGGLNLPEGLNRSAADKLTQALTADQAGVSSLDKLGPNAFLPDAGPSLLGLAQAVATKPGEGKSLLVDALSQRNAGTNERINADVNAALGPSQSPLSVANKLQDARSQVHSELPEAFQNAPPIDVTPVLSFIGEKLNTAVGPEHAALLKARDYLMDRSANGIPVPVTNAEKVANAKVALQALVSYGDSTIGVPPGALSKAEGVTKRVIGSLNARLRDKVPGYAGIMDRSSKIAKLIEGIEEGQGILSSGAQAVRPDDFARRLEGASNSEVGSLQVGARSAINRSLGTKINDLQALRQDLQGEGGWNEQKLALLFGQKPAADLAESVARNAKFRDTHGKVVDNSQTAQRTIASQALDASVSKGPIVPKNVTITGLIGNAGESFIRKIAEGKADFEGQKTRAAIGRVLAMSPSPEREKLLAGLMQRSFIVDENGRRIGNAAALLTGSIGFDEARQRAMAHRRQ